MKRTPFSTIRSMIHRQPKPGAGRVVALCVCEGIYRLSSFRATNAVTSIGILESLNGWMNRDPQLQSGRCRVNLALT
ncbi:MAG: hypothetical protein HC852_09590 [Acaryochloridaceae cyanobacterium RU_4_10]|nr:hypothetical protein [Acaryochloridaceae cyanobacterium RU_4_10]